MEKIEITKDIFSGAQCICAGTNVLFQMSNGDILKIFSPSYIVDFNRYTGNSMEDKILSAKEICGVPEIIVPKNAMYFNNCFVGYTTEGAVGTSYFEYTKNFTKSEQEDLYNFAEMYSAIERPVRKASNVIFPDLCTSDNIFISRESNGYRVQFIDYDGLQVDDQRSFCISTGLGDPKEFVNKKYLDENKFFTKELDKKSLIHLYFLSAFNIDLSQVNKYYPGIKRSVALDECFAAIQLDDLDVMEKVYKVMQDKGTNEYLGDDVFRLADTYQMRAFPVPGMSHYYLKVLEKKR